MCIFPLNRAHPRQVFSLHILTCVLSLDQLHLFCDSDNVHCYLLKDVLLSCFFFLGVSIIWDSSSSSGCPSVHVSVSLVVSLKGSKIPLTSFPCSICACFVQVAKVYRYKAYHIYIYIPLFVHWSPQVYSIVCLKYLKGLSLNKLSKVHYFTAYFKVVQRLHLEVLLK